MTLNGAHLAFAQQLMSLWQQAHPLSESITSVPSYLTNLPDFSSFGSWQPHIERIPHHWVCYHSCSWLCALLSHRDDQQFRQAAMMLWRRMGCGSMLRSQWWWVVYLIWLKGLGNRAQKLGSINRGFVLYCVHIACLLIFIEQPPSHEGCVWAWFQSEHIIRDKRVAQQRTGCQNLTSGRN